ncbi:hypothetical protein [Catenulispora sp. EB89]|uniref:SbtR family transcriptional regulator n=1 Tax=Catenulispora sp. EB89 TaxID=3156257 RepID=UPI0035123DAE
MEDAGEALLRSAVAAGSARADVSVADLLVVVNAIAGATAGAPAGDTLRLLALVRDGVRPRDEPLAPLVAGRPR